MLEFTQTGMSQKLVAACFLGAMAFATPALAQAPIGQTAVVVRDVSGDLGGTVRTLAVANPVHTDEVISTGADSATEITFEDQTQLSLGPDSRITLDEFTYDPASNLGSLVIDMTVGVMRFASGSMKEEGVVITTPVATIGIRGTIVTVLVALNGTTTMIVEQGVGFVTSATGAAVTVETPGLSSTVAPGAPPSPPAPPPAEAVDTVTAMDSTLNEGTAAGDGGLDTAFGDIEPVVPAIAAAAIIGTILAVSGGDGDDDTSPAATGAGGGGGTGGP